MFPHVCSLLIPSTLFQYAFLHSVPPITPLKPNPPLHSFPVLLSPLRPSHYSLKPYHPFHSFPVLLSPLRPSHYPVKTISPPLLFFSILLSPLGPSHYSVKTKSSLSLFSSTVLLSPLDPSHYSVKTNPPSVPPSLCPFFLILSSVFLPPPVSLFPSIAFSIRSLPFLR